MVPFSDAPTLVCFWHCLSEFWSLSPAIVFRFRVGYEGKVRQELIQELKARKAAGSGEAGGC